ncbi:hypothetical protein NIES37_69380 (plasmid) [Tolypothrix tenuis PCC 7101]|uniref:Helicase A859L n=1 Tax=Tolypothrix tenuis PCC 7101 TaxID=231146 RepID=A0A1Z4NB59_9CYAN|nr:GIY-YIG nuclease family protein [Aulosira sp. FACHB-113]BAZ02925.1 hypothetical protein NIES37_69380 [Tolypothrix tenuis PCC 7101]BAZ78152.1 hypothetical protein NIES50_67850 [Aulosira laxa NIES-50]
MSTKNLSIYFIEKVPGDIFKGLGWIKIDCDIAHRLQIPVKYTGVIKIPNPEPYCCPINPEDKLPWIKPNYHSHYYIHPPEIRGKNKKFIIHIKGENTNLYAQYSLTVEAIVSWLLSWADKDVRLITPGNRSISLSGNIKLNQAFVYFIFNSDSYAIKIGRDSNVEKRLQSLQTSSPVTLEILKVLPMESLKKAQEVEAYLHKRFGHLRMSGEWFRADPQLRDYITRCDESYFKDKFLAQPSPRSSVRLSEL